MGTPLLLLVVSMCLGTGIKLDALTIDAESQYVVTILGNRYAKSPSNSDQRRLFEGNDARHVMMMNKNGREYSCSIPLPAGGSDDADLATVEELPKEDALLAPLEGKCVYRLTGWWTYEFCHKQHIRQFHQESKKPVEKEFFLGQYVSQAQSSTEANDAAREYYSEYYSDGTPCDLTGEPRTAEVRYVCSAGDGTTFANVQEPSTCSYVITINSPLLCEHPHFALPEDPVTKITCIPSEKMGITLEPEPEDEEDKEDELGESDGLVDALTYALDVLHTAGKGLAAQPSSQSVSANNARGTAPQRVSTVTTPSTSTDDKGPTSVSPPEQFVQDDEGDGQVIETIIASSVEEMMEKLAESSVLGEVEIGDIQYIDMRDGEADPALLEEALKKFFADADSAVAEAFQDDDDEQSKDEL